MLPLRLAPTASATPNSAIALLKLVITARNTPPVDSLKTAIEASLFDAPKVLAKLLISGSADSTALIVRLTIIGVIKID